ncbi:fibrobacter succinogenes major paralogous domain-containing protein [Fibrobacter sp.]|uniref:fibrobacter succinogenes major paralogous domain-containing protein n=1 Tax=Fibrobacter sp. TaxID=35828 RepID=UPI0038675D0B
MAWNRIGCLAAFSFAIVFAACGDDSSENRDVAAISDKTISGVSQKGPFVKGSSVTVQELDGKTLVRTGNSYEGKIKNDMGEFSIKVNKLVSQYALLKANGFYRNEVTCKKSKSQVTLYALTDLSDRDEVNINLLTHLEYERSLYLAVDDTMTVAAAKKQAEREVLASFGISGDFANFEDLNIFGAGDGAAALLAISILMQGDLSEADFSERLANYAADIETDGTWNDAKMAAEIADWGEKRSLGESLSDIRAKITGWGLSSDVPDFEKYIDNFWWQNYGLGTCGGSRNGEVKKNENSLSDNYSFYFICENNAWRVASDTEYDTYQQKCDEDGKIVFGNENKDYAYDCDMQRWRHASNVETALGGCVEKRFGEVAETDGVYYICQKRVWRKATDIEKDTFGWKDSTDGAIKKGNVTDTVYVFDKTAWRATSNVESKLGGCANAIADSVGKVGSSYYICKSNKWVVASALEFDTYHWAAGKDGDSKTGSVNEKNCYVYEDEAWRSGNASDCLLGLRGCTVLRQDTVGKGVDKEYHVCDAKKWRGATIYEKDTFGWKDSTDGAIKKGNVTDGIYVFDKIAWRAASNVESKLGGCVSVIADSVGIVDGSYYICKSNKWVESSVVEYDTYHWAAGRDGDCKWGSVNTKNCYVYEKDAWRSGDEYDCSLGLRGCTALRQDTVGKGSDKVWLICRSRRWVEASAVEYDTFGWKDSTDGAIKKGNETDCYYVFDKTAWRAASNVESTLGGCTNAIADSVGKVDMTYYICKSNVWAEASVTEYDTYRWSAGTDDEVRLGNVISSNHYVFEDGSWRKSANDMECNYGVCTTSRESEKRLLNDKYFICENKSWKEITAVEYNLGYCRLTNDATVKILNDVYYICVLYEWVEATASEDTYREKCSKDGAIVDGKIFPANKYVCDKGTFRAAREQEISLNKGCVSYTENEEIRKQISEILDSVYICKYSSWIDSAEWRYGNLLDTRDQKTYKTIVIGTQTWMAENLNYSDSKFYSKYRAKCYNDTLDYCAKYGRLYTWSAAMDSIGVFSTNGKGCGRGKICSLTYPVRGICPEGWHLPSVDEIKTLVTTVGGDDPKLANKVLKSTNGWWNRDFYDETIENGLDAYGFSALPSGRYGNGSYSLIGEITSFWSSSQYEDNPANYSYTLTLRGNEAFARPIGFGNPVAGYSVRCVKD